MWVDEMLHTGVWKQIMSKFSSEWQDLVTYSTIMLNANVAFLAIQSVDIAAPSRSWAQIFSYALTVANLACMILGLLLMRQNRTKKRETAELVYKYLKKQNSELTGLEALAIMFSLPHASLMWGMVSFFVAFSLMCVRSANVQTHIVVISCLSLTVLYIIWCIYLAWETNPKDTSQDDRTLAYSQDAELRKAREEEQKREEEMAQDRATESSESHES
ncbi:hypothetical protein D9619_008037 [Psilocybe cf. subviscida]|uniref:Uncharacterized protein n=1 Tax=Psilocybe cf. subviscida TaxID=2480587 RepID=A0A8H5ESW9_9AGAR|nr:hypothetical protein D9619_008037 [Psilocybe cf. subviscida]